MQISTLGLGPNAIRVINTNDLNRVAQFAHSNSDTKVVAFEVDGKTVVLATREFGEMQRVHKQLRALCIDFSLAPPSAVRAMSLHAVTISKSAFVQYLR